MSIAQLLSTNLPLKTIHRMTDTRIISKDTTQAKQRERERETKPTITTSFNKQGMPNWANNGEQWWAIDRQIVCPRYRIRFQTHSLPETDTKSVRGNKRKERKSDRTEATPKELFQFSSTYASLITLSLSLPRVRVSPMINYGNGIF